MKKVVFLLLVCFAFTSASVVEVKETKEEARCTITVGPLFAFSQQGNSVLYEWAFDTSCPIPPCPPPGFIIYDVEIEYGNDVGGTTVWSNNEVHSIYHLSTVPVHSFSATINHRSKYMRFKVRVDPSTTGCSTPWSAWQVYQFY